MRNKLFSLLVLSALLSLALTNCAAPAPEKVVETVVVTKEVVVTATPAPPVGYKIGFVVKNLGNPFFEASHKGAAEAAAELGDLVIYQGPATPTAEGQIEIIDALIAQRVDAIAITTNDPDALVPVCKKAMDAGIKVITWDSAVAPEGRQIFVNQADMEQIGRIEVQMLGEMLDYEGQIAVLSAAATMANQNTWIEWMKEELKDPKYANMELVGVVYGDDLREKSYNEALGLFKSYPDLKGIISPTTVGIAATGRALTDEGLCGKIHLTGLGLPSEMAEYIKSGCCEEMALWNPIELGYLAVYVSHYMATGEIKGEPGETFTAGKLGERTVVSEDGGVMVLLGPPFKFNADNIDDWADVY
jgi:rhamnose transport system substrate-binding protein